MVIDSVDRVTSADWIPGHYGRHRVVGDIELINMKTGE